MWYIFYLEVFHFVINIFAFLTFFSVFYLYFDAWLIRKDKKEIFRFLGYLFLSLSFLLRSVSIQSDILRQSLFFEFLGDNIFPIFRFLGYFLLLVSLFLDPLPKIPLEKAFLFLTPFYVPSLFLYPLMSSLIAFLYWRHFTLGLERHLKKISLSFFLLSLSEVFSLASLFRNTDNINIFNLVSPFKLFWFVSNGFLLFSLIVLSIWIWYYLLKRISTQLFIVFETVSVAVFIITTVVLSSLLIRSIENDKKKQMITDIKVLHLAIQARKESLLSQAKLLAKDEKLVSYLLKGDRKNLSDLSEDYLLDYQKTSVVILSKDGQILAKGESKEGIGGSLSDDPLVKRAFEEGSITGLVKMEQLLFPAIALKAVVSVFEGDNLVGFLILIEQLDNSFLDGIKKSTGLDSSLYGGNRISASTLLSFQGNDSLIGLEERDGYIIKEVLSDRKTISRSTHILGVPYVSVFSPIVSVDGQAIGMFFIGQPEIEILKTVASAVQLTFLVTILMILFSVLPIYIIARYIASQMR